ncbi:MAG: discoidin domain-containing protein, partial [Prolixibacteraceae bacterium]|nr:discoidin domain-containing protein [Prolixibacteraceae bacterium]
HCQNISIENNLIDYVGHMGVLLCGYGPGTKDVNKNNRIVNNIIDHCGDVVWHGHAIFIWQSGSNYVANNLIQNCPRKAVGICGVRAPIFMEGKKVDWDEGSKTMRWNEIDPRLDDAKNINQEAILPYLHAKDNLVENNEIFRCRTKIGDGASLNVSGAGQGNIIRNNLLLEVVGNGLRTDDWQRGTVFSNNLICSGGIVHKGKNDILNNIFVDTNIRFTTYPGQKYFPGSLVKNNIMYFTRNGIIPYKERKTPDIYTPNDCVLENNIYFAESKVEEIEAFIHKNQIEKGWDKGSVVVDPLFAKPIPKNRKLKKEDLILSENSPAYKMGFKKINIESIGITNDFPSKLKAHIFPEFERKWISKSADVRFSSIAESINNYEKIILQSKNEPEIFFAVKTKTEKNPYAIIDLKAKKEIESFSIVGSSKNDDKSYNSLVVFVSDNGVNWKQVWANDPYNAQTGRMWEVVLQNKIEARFVKIQLEGEHVLTLKTANIYGS